MKLHGYALRLTIFIGDTDLWHHRPLYHEIVHRAREAGLAGTSVIRGMEGSLDELIGEGLVILDEVEVIRYIGRASDRPRKERRR